MRYTRDIIILFVFGCIVLGMMSCANQPIRYSDDIYSHYHSVDVVPLMNNVLMEKVEGMYALDDVRSACGGRAVGCVIPHEGRYYIYMLDSLTFEERMDVVVHEFGHIYDIEILGYTYEDSAMHPSRVWWKTRR